MYMIITLVDQFSSTSLMLSSTGEPSGKYTSKSPLTFKEGSSPGFIEVPSTKPEWYAKKQDAIKQTTTMKIGNFVSIPVAPCFCHSLCSDFGASNTASSVFLAFQSLTFSRSFSWPWPKIRDSLSCSDEESSFGPDSSSDIMPPQYPVTLRPFESIPIMVIQSLQK